MDLSQFAAPLAGGILIGLSAVIMMLFNGQIAGISGIFRGLMFPDPGDTLWRFLFIGGLVVGGILLAAFMPWALPTEFVHRSTGMLVFGGLAVGFGVRLGSGCTSGHGVCGIGRFSPRSIIATLTFITTGAITVYLVNSLFGGAA